MQKELINKKPYNLEVVSLFLQQIFQNWRAAIQGKVWLWHVFITLLLILPLYLYLVPYLQYIEARPGIVLNDIILNQVEARNLSVLIFGVVYTGALVVILYFIRSPWLTLRNIQIFLVLQYLRNLCLYITPLAPPIGIIPLHDPILEFVAYGQKPLLQDLFFSGHTAAIVIFALVTRKKNYLFVGFLLISILMAYLLIVQHCHYTIDIIGGAVFGILSYYLVKLIWLRLKLPFE